MTTGSGFCSIQLGIEEAENEDMDVPSETIKKTKLVEPAEEHAIRRRAYEFYEQRGRGDGSALDDWLRAEQEIKGSRNWRIGSATR